MKIRLVPLLFVLVLLAAINWRLPVLRFSNHWANEVFCLLISCIFLVLVGLAIARVNKNPNRWVALPLTLGLLLIGLPFLIATGINSLSLPSLANEKDVGFIKIEQIDKNLAVYRTNGGATTAYGIEIRQERNLVPGLLLVKRVFSHYRLDKIAYVKAGNHLTVSDPYSDQVLQEVSLSRFFYL